MIKMSQNHLTGKVSNSNLLKPLAATSTWLSAEENTSVSIIAVVISQVIKVHLNIKDTDVPGIKQFK